MIENTAIDLLNDAACTLGEGALWDHDAQTLYWVDILGQRIHATVWGTAETIAVKTPSYVGCVGLRASGGLVAALQHGVAFCDVATGAISPGPAVERHLPTNRFNDGGVDPRGRFWFGSMDMEEKDGTGALYRLDADGAVTLVIDGIICSNGPVWSPAGDTMYHVDSARKLITAYEFDLATGDLGKPSTFVDDRENPWFPDGMAVDEEGFIWSCKWDGGRVVRYSPDGEIDRVLALPVPRPTRCAFVGSNMESLVITSARVGLDSSQIAAAPLSGRLLVLDPGVKGTASHKYAG